MCQILVSYRMAQVFQNKLIGTFEACHKMNIRELRGL